MTLISTTSEDESNLSAEDMVTGFGSKLKKCVLDRALQGIPQIKLSTDFRTFKNIIHFVTSPDGLAMNTLYNFNRQYQYCRDFYGLLCPECNVPGPDPNMPYDCWGKSPTQLQEDILLEKNTAGHYECPQCGKLQSELAIPSFKELIGVCGMRSGKTVLAALILLYELHCDLLLENPQKTWGLAPGQEVYFTVATTQGEQAKDTIFAAIDGILSNSPWFIRYINALRQGAKAQNISFDSVFVKNLSEIRFLHKQLFVDLTGSNSAGIAGKTRKVCVVDEVARFVETESRMGVDAVYDTLKASLLTLSQHGSKMICISSPWYKTDKIMRLKDDALRNIEEAKTKGKMPSILVFHHPTWDFNPNIKFEDEFIQTEFQKNPVAARRDFGADPPGAADPWMPDEWRIDECIDPEIPQLVHSRDFTHTLIIKGKQSSMVAKGVDDMVLDLPTTKHVAIACDPGHRHDSFGMVMGYVKAIRTARGIEEHLFVGSVLDWVPREKPRVEVDFRNVLQVLKKFANHWHVDKVVYDQWNSVLQIQELQAVGIDAEKIPLKKEDWDLLAALFYNKQIHLLHPKVGGRGAERLLWELKNLQLKENGRVDHSPMTSSDVAVCLARLAKVMVNPEYGMQRILDQQSRVFGGRVVSFRRP